MRVRSDDGGLVLDDLAEGVALAAATGRVEVRDLCGTLEVRGPGGPWVSLMPLLGAALAPIVWPTGGGGYPAPHDPRCVLHAVPWTPACATFTQMEPDGELCATCGHYRACHG